MEHFNVSGLVGKTMIQVVHVIIGLDVGGAELMLKRLIESQLERPNIQHQIISLTSLGKLGPELQKQGVQIYPLGMSSMLKGPVVLFKLRALLKKLQPDVVHTWMYHSDLIGGLAAYSLGIRNIIWGIRSTDITKGGSKVTLIVRKICALLSNTIPRKILCAATTSKDVHVEVGYDSNRMEVIPNGFDVDKFSDNESAAKVLRNDLGINQDDNVFISVGRYNPVKDHITFVKAACSLLEVVPNIKFMLVGRELTWKNEKIASVIKDAGKEASFDLLGERSDVPVCLAAANVYCLHSLTEGFPNVLGEAMCSGLICITTDVGDAGYLLNRPSLTVKPGCSTALTEAMLKVAELSQDDGLKISSENKNRIKNNFSMEVISMKYSDLYMDLCKV